MHLENVWAGESICWVWKGVLEEEKNQESPWVCRIAPRTETRRAVEAQAGDTRGLFGRVQIRTLIKRPHGDVKEAAGSGSWGPRTVRVGG